MDKNTVWSKINSALEVYNSLKLDQVVDYKKYYLYSIITHSTAIEGSTLTDAETKILFDNGLTAKGKPLVHHLMNDDLKNAYFFALDCSKNKIQVSVDFLKELNACVMKSTGVIMETIAGKFDSSKGNFRLCNVSAGRGGSSYMNYTKIQDKMNEFSLKLQDEISTKTSIEEKYNLSFDAHYNLVTIHPWLDGNGRTSRLLMNYIQFSYDLMPVKVYSEEKSEYIAALVDAQNNDDVEVFRFFMAQQLLKLLIEENNGVKIN
jgi:Fic family protein